MFEFEDTYEKQNRKQSQSKMNSPPKENEANIHLLNIKKFSSSAKKVFFDAKN
jgi:hypothetical protein